MDFAEAVAKAPPGWRHFSIGDVARLPSAVRVHELARVPPGQPDESIVRFLFWTFVYLTLWWTHPHDAFRVNPTSGEQMWSAQDVIRAGAEADQPLCGGQLCRAGQFCCGPPACGHCAYPMAGPRCPGTCPGQSGN